MIYGEKESEAKNSADCDWSFGEDKQRGVEIDNLDLRFLASLRMTKKDWVPAFAGMTVLLIIWGEMGRRTEEKQRIAGSV